MINLIGGDIPQDLMLPALPVRQILIWATVLPAAITRSKVQVTVEETAPGGDLILTGITIPAR